MIAVGETTSGTPSFGYTSSSGAPFFFFSRWLYSFFSRWLYSPPFSATARSPEVTIVEGSAADWVSITQFWASALK